MIKMEGLDLSYFFTTKNEASEFSARLTAVLEKVYEVNFNLEKALQTQFGIKKKDKFIALLRENEIPVESNSALIDFINKIKDSIASLPIATLTLAVEPNESMLKAISSWFLLNLNKQILFEIQIDPDLVGGAAINYQGKYYNFSVKPEFEKICTDALLNVVIKRRTERLPINLTPKIR